MESRYESPKISEHRHRIIKPVSLSNRALTTSFATSVSWRHMKARIAIIAVLLPLIITKLIQPNEAQEMPLEYQQVLKTVAKTGDYKSNVLKVNIPRNDIHVTIDNLAVPRPFGFGGWFAMSCLLCSTMGSI